MPNPLDDRLRDDIALAEIELTGQLMIAASQHSGHLTQGEVDEILGINAAQESRHTVDVTSTAGKSIAS